MLRFLVYCSVFASALIFPRKNNGIKLNPKVKSEQDYPSSVNPDFIKTNSDLEIENCELQEPYPDCEFETYQRLILKDKQMQSLWEEYYSTSGETYQRLVLKDRQMRALWNEYYNTSGEIYPEDVINRTDDYPLLP